MDISEYKAAGVIPDRHLLNLTEWSEESVYEVLRTAARVRGALARRRDLTGCLPGKSLCLFYPAPDPHEEAALERAMRLLGGDAIRYDAAALIRSREAIPDTARALAGAQFDFIALGGTAQSDAIDFSKYGSYHVINCSSSDYRPLRSLSDLFTIYEIFGRLTGLKLVYYGAGGALCDALILACAKVGIHITIVTPKGFEPLIDVVACAKRSVDVTVTHDPRGASARADVLYSTACPEGQESVFAPYGVRDAYFKSANPDAIYMNPLPAHRNEEATANIIDAPFSAIARQSAATLPVAAGILLLLSGWRPGHPPRKQPHARKRRESF